MRQLGKFVLILVLLGGATSSQAQVVRTWVATTGEDTNPCTRTAPCRNFAAAIAAVDADGEVVVLDSGGYGPFTTNKSVSIISPPGIHAAIAPTSGNAVWIQTAASPIAVNLRGLYLNAQGASTGVFITGNGVVHVENCAINGFIGKAVDVAVGNPADLYVVDSVLRNNGTGIQVDAAESTARALIDHCRIEMNSDDGVHGSDGSQIVVRDSVISGNLYGVRAKAPTMGRIARVSVENSAIVGIGDPESIGILAETANGAATVNVWRTTVSTCHTGISVGAGQTIRLSDCTINRNTTGLFNISGTLESRQNNTVIGNNTDTFATITNFSPI